MYDRIRRITQLILITRSGDGKVRLRLIFRKHVRLIPGRYWVARPQIGCASIVGDDTLVER
jgi:hypothetical protein